MESLIQPLRNLAEYEEIVQASGKRQGMVQVSGCMESQKAHFIYSLASRTKRRLLIAENDLKAKALYEDYQLYDPQVLLYPAKDLIFYQADIQGNLLAKQRIRVIQALLEQESVTVVASAAGCMNYLLELEQVAESVLTINNDSAIDLEQLKKDLVFMGYERTVQVETSGQFSIRGGIVDVFPLTQDYPWRIELWGDEVDSIRSFDASSQRSIENVESIRIYPAMEMVLNEAAVEQGKKAILAESQAAVKAFRDEFKTEEGARLAAATKEICEQLEEQVALVGADSYIHYFFPQTVSLLDYFDQDSLIVVDEPNRLKESAAAVAGEFRESMINRLEKGYILPGQVQMMKSSEQLTGTLNSRGCVGISLMEPHSEGWDISRKFQLTVKMVNPYNNSFELLVKDLIQWKKAGYQVVLLSGSQTRAKRLAEDLRNEGLNSFFSEDPARIIQKGEIKVMQGRIRKGFEYPLIKFVVISDSDIFGAEKKKKRKKKEYSGQQINSFTELNVGDYVVHENHGLGVYRGIEKVEMDKVIKDYIKIEYSGKSNLYILATQLEALQKYAGADARKPKLNKLGGQEWNRTKARVKGAVKNIAKDLVALYASRQEQEGFVYGKDTVWQQEFEEMFPFEETEDQMLAIDATKRDMESKRIMDRLICGDVGYGKTEIAVRAAFKAVQEGKQVVYLVPTTILAQQHYNTFVQRMKEFPVRVDLLCRFRTKAEQLKTIADLKRGLVDIVIGTHRVLSADVVFKDLGLLVIDEEQRFGVTHKEKIKNLKNNIDVMTLTATPIPRTLHMSLIGIRDMSVLEEPPMDRMPIQTFVLEYNEEMVRDAISRELARNGQVYYVYNRVNDIVEVANRIAALVPEANVAFAHGQMRERELEKIMYGFISGEIDVLVTTTIIETGLDISNVNTIIIHDSDQMGLSQLYQLRGRVGRSNRTAYAFLMYRRNKMLKEVAEKRLHAIREFTDLGSGFKIAMRDLEIRGAGNLLGAEQHGHMEAVGYDLYCKMLNEAVKKEKGIESDQEEFETTIDLSMDAFIPEKYIPNEYQKLDIYKRIASIANNEEYEDMQEELVDRFGDLPKSVLNLLAIANLKATAHQADIIEVKQRGTSICLTMHEHARINPVEIPKLLEQYKTELTFKIESNPYFLYRPRLKNSEDTGELLDKTRQVIEELLSFMVK